MDEHPDLAALGPSIVERLVAQHHHSQWSDLKRVFEGQHGDRTGERFSAFLGGRGLMINFLDLEWRVQPRVERELAVRLSSDPKITVQEYFVDFGALRRISRMVPRLKDESIETYDDFVWAVCSLEAPLKKEAFLKTIEHFDATESRVRARAPGSIFKSIELVFAALHAQLDPLAAGRFAALAPLMRPDGRIRAAEVQHLLPGISQGPALDKLWLGLRNERWAQRIDEHARAGRTGLFYVLGAAHLLDYEHFDGLITLLEKRGFRVMLVGPGGRLTPLTHPSSDTSPPASPSSSPPSTGTRR